MYGVIEFCKLKILIKEVIENLKMISEKLDFVLIYTVYENNTGALVVKAIPMMTHTLNNTFVKCH